MKYDFKCDDCKLNFEVNQHIFEEHTSACPECGQKAQRVYSSLEWVWKGEAYRPDGSKRQHDDYASVMGG